MDDIECSTAVSLASFRKPSTDVVVMITLATIQSKVSSDDQPLDMTVFVHSPSFEASVFHGFALSRNQDADIEVRARLGADYVAGDPIKIGTTFMHGTRCCGSAERIL